jgi:hypothetical protein
MFSLDSLFGEKPDHPMVNVGEASKLLAGLPKDNPFKALDEVTAWLESVKSASGFYPETRTDIVMLLDETGQPLYVGLLRDYLGAPHLQDFEGLRQWQAMHGFLHSLAEAYAACASAYREAGKPSPPLERKMPVVCVRLLRAVAGKMKLELMRYLEVGQSAWERLCDGYRFAEDSQITETLVHAYPGQAVHTSPQHEFLRALVLHISSPGTLATDQIEVADRITGRLAGAFDFRTEPDPDCTHCIDLFQPDAPAHVADTPAVTAGTRFFGTTRAVPKIAAIIEQNERNLIEREQRFGNEFTSGGKLTVLKHLETYWGKNPPHRHQERRGINAAIEVVHGFRTISQLVTNIDLGSMTNLSGEEAAELKKRSALDLSKIDDIQYTPEAWAVSDVSINGIGGVIPKTAGAWVKIGALCGIKSQNNPLWWVGMIRRLHTGPDGHGSHAGPSATEKGAKESPRAPHVNDAVHVGIEILAKRPLSVWLRALGKGAEKASNWETSSGSFEYDYLPVILLPDAHNAYAHATMLMEPGSFVPGNIYEMMMGEKSRNIKLLVLLAEGDDYEQASFQWLAPEHP